MKIPRTLGEIEALDLEILTCEQISKVLKADPYSIHKQAEADAASLGFPVIICGNRVKIPRRAFVAFMKGEMKKECQNRE